jgi:cytochrome P450
MPGGKGHAHHKRLRRKILASMGPKPTLAFVPKFIEFIRDSLDDLVEQTAKHGFGAFEPMASQLASRVSALPITAGLDNELQKRIEGLLDITMEGMFGGGVPIDLGRFNSFGRGMVARRQLSEIIEDLMKCSNLSNDNIIRDLSRATEDGEAFTLGEVVDTVFTLMVAGKETTSDAMPALLVSLHEHPSWAEKIAQEPLVFDSVEKDSATLRVIRESLRRRPPAGAYRRVCDTAVDFGEHGRVPAGCPMAILFGHELQDMGSDFNPDRWKDEATVREYGNLVFGGSQPHSCIGKSVALIELQLFARILCREYVFKPLTTELVVKMPPLKKTYKDSLPVAVYRK